MKFRYTKTYITSYIKENMFKNWNIRYYRYKHGINKVEGIELVNTNVISPSEQIMILENVIKYIESNNINSIISYRFGLCYMIWKQFILLDGNKKIGADKIIPIFNKHNALEYGNGKNDGAYWWSVDREDFDIIARVEFCKWMIKVIEIESKKY